MLDYIKEKLHGRIHLCCECANYISNNMINELYTDNQISCEGGGFCCPTYGVPYFIGVDRYQKFCHKFKFRNTEFPKSRKKTK